MKTIYLSLLITFCSFQSNAQTSFFNPDAIQIGLFSGTESLDLEKTSPSNDYIHFISDRLYPVFKKNIIVNGSFEMETRGNLLVRASLGYSKMNQSLAVESIGSTTYLCTPIAPYLNIGLHIGYALRFKKYEIVPSIGGGGNFKLNKKDFSAGLTGTSFSSIIYRYYFEKQHYYTLEGGLRLRYWFLQNLGIELAGNYAHSFENIVNIHIDYNMERTPGEFTGSRTGTKKNFGIGILYRFDLGGDKGM
ncbi:MAG: hypothetical protein R2784_02535 [Saprospiraceae bacterium]